MFLFENVSRRPNNIFFDTLEFIQSEIMSLKFKDIFYPLLFTQCSAIILHVSVIYLIRKSRETRRRDKIQPLFLINLSFIDIMQSLAGIATDLLELHEHCKAKRYLEYVNFGLYVIYMFFIISLTSNRFFDIYLNIHYELYWNIFKTKVLMTLVWIVGIACGISLIILQIFNVELPKLFVLLSITLDIVTLIISVVTNGYILIKLIHLQKHRRRLTKRYSNESNNSSSRKQKLQEKVNCSYFLISGLVLSTILFLLIPNLIVHLMPIKLIPLSLPFVYICYLLYAFGLVMDAVLYILLFPISRKTLFQILHCKREKYRRRFPSETTEIMQNQKAEIV